jgi:hypothetical protein
VVEVDVPARDGVGYSDSGQPRRRGRVSEEADESERARDEECGADERKGGRPTPVQPEKDDGRNRQVERQVGNAKQAGETRQRIDSVLHPPLHEQMQRPLDRNELLGVTVRFRGVADD